VNNQY